MKPAGGMESETSRGLVLTNGGEILFYPERFVYRNNMKPAGG